MVTVNKRLQKLTKEDVLRISQEWIMGFTDIERKYGFRLAGLNSKRKSFGLSELTKDISMDYRIQHIKDNHDYDEIYEVISKLLFDTRVCKECCFGIEIFDCRFSYRERVRAFRRLIGSSEYRKLSEKARIKKLRETQILKYGGVGLAGKATQQKALETVVEKYGVSNVMQNEEIKNRLATTNMKRYGDISPFSSEKVRDNANMTKIQNVQTKMEKLKKTGVVPKGLFKQSPCELLMYTELITRFGESDVLYQYGIHPSDKRYPYNCDFYIKSLDLFIEFNGHYSHGKHWYDKTSKQDRNRRKQLLASDSRKSRISVKTWCEKDVEKRECAKRSQIKYLVFWDGSRKTINKRYIYPMVDFYKWLREYDCNYEMFIKDFPENTY